MMELLLLMLGSAVVGAAAMYLFMGGAGGARAIQGGGRSTVNLATALTQTLLVVGIAVAVFLPFSPFALLGLAYWAASWDIEGSGGPRYWLLVKGSRLDQLGLVAPTARPARYSVSLQEGTFPGYSTVTYESSHLPSAIVAAYAERCGAMALKVTKREPVAGDGGADAAAATLVCEIRPDIDVEIYAERLSSAASASVSVKLWGSD
jgi:hypothetical protein